MHSVRADRSGHVLVRVEEDRVVCTGLSAKLVDEGLPLFKERFGNAQRHRNYTTRRRLPRFPAPAPCSWARGHPLVPFSRPGRQLALSSFGSRAPFRIFDLALGVDRIDHRLPEFI